MLKALLPTFQVRSALKNQKNKKTEHTFTFAAVSVRH
jgi:hypothetical protein